MRRWFDIRYALSCLASGFARKGQGERLGRAETVTVQATELLPEIVSPVGRIHWTLPDTVLAYWDLQ